MQNVQQAELYNQERHNEASQSLFINIFIPKIKIWNLPSFSGVPSWCLSVPLGIAFPLKTQHNEDKKNKRWMTVQYSPLLTAIRVDVCTTVPEKRATISLTCVALEKWHCPLQCPPLHPPPDLQRRLPQDSGQTAPQNLRHQPAGVLVLGAASGAVIVKRELILSDLIWSYLILSYLI